MTSSKPNVNTTETVANLRDVTVTYDGYLTRALSHVTLEFRRGEVTGVLGEKGAGKSSVFKVLAGQMAPTEGQVRVFGRSPRGGAKARIGYLPGKLDFDRPPGFVDRLLGRKKKSSPGGRGVARLAQAMLGNRDLLVLDDPFAELEPAELAEAKALIRDMVSRGKTVVLSSDALMDVRDLCERMVILHEGKVQAVGTLDELLSSATAIRFLPAILPAEIVTRVLGVLREEIQRVPKIGSTSHSPTKVIPATPGQSVQTNDPIDHKKLEGLTKPSKPQ
jgi:ABC-type multidrug transport system ATPase subunit